MPGSPETDETWLNWIVRRRSDSQPVGTVQATLRDGGETALVAWVIGVEWQKQGFASEAARALVDWLREQGVQQLVARIHPAHVASGAVAARAGLEPTEEEIGGEQVWRSHLGRPADSLASGQAMRPVELRLPGLFWRSRGGFE